MSFIKSKANLPSELLTLANSSYHVEVPWITCSCKLLEFALQQFDDDLYLMTFFFQETHHAHYMVCQPFSLFINCCIWRTAIVSDECVLNSLHYLAFWLIHIWTRVKYGMILDVECVQWLKMIFNHLIPSIYN